MQDLISMLSYYEKERTSCQASKTENRGGSTKELRGEHQEIIYNNFKVNKTHLEKVKIDLIVKFSLNVVAMQGGGVGRNRTRCGLSQKRVTEERMVNFTRYDRRGRRIRRKYRFN